MKHTINSSPNPANDRDYVQSSKLFLFGILLIAAASSILASPKWGIAFFAWVAPFCYLYFLRIGNIKRKLLWFFAIIVITSIIASYDVAPFPLPVLIILGIIESMKTMIIYITDKWLTKKSSHFLTTLFFPAAFVSMEFMSTKLGGGIWWSIANTQYSFSWLTQLASVTGMWGISFLIYWFGSVAVWSLAKYAHAENYKRGLLIYGTTLALVLSFGIIRYNFNSLDKNQYTKIAGLSVPLMGYLENIYKDYCGKNIIINPKTSISSPQLQRINQAQLPFIETADTIKFKNGYHTLQNANDSLFILSQQAVDKGAKIIVWSEANAIVFKFDEAKLIERGKKFASDNNVYLLMAIASIHNGKITAGYKFLENQAVFIGPDGHILNVFHKNNPVPIAEASVPGDGRIPVIETPYGRISTSICYDADFPAQMRQLGKNKSDVLLLPSGDWYAIAPYHTYMATFRGIENGCSIVRQASGGLSIATDYRGKVCISFDFYKPGVKSWIADVPIGHVQTIYTIIGDVFAYGCMVVTGIGLLYILSLSFTGKKQGE